MPKTMLVSQSADGWVRVTVHGCLLKMRQATYAAAIAAGKAELRATQQSARERNAQAMREAE